MRTTRYLENRGASEVLGSILIFAIAMMALVLFQTHAVPSANEAVEFDHNQEAQQDLLGLDAELTDAAATGRGGAQLVTLGTDYPNRFLLRNPPPVAGTLSTEPSGFTLTNARAVGNPETADYWDGSPRSYDSRRLVYRVDYNVYDSAPTTVLAHGAVYDRFPDDRTRRIDERGPVDGRTVDIAALQGRRSGSRVGPVSVSVSAPSAPTRTVRVTNAGGPLTLTLQTEASAEAWRAFLADQFVAEGGHVQAVRNGGSGAVEVVLEPGVTYELRLASVAVGTGATDPGPQYLTAVSDAPSTVAGQPVDLTAEVRDRFNGPVAGEDITFETTDGSLSGTTATSDDEGRATVRFTPDAAGPATVTASADFDGSGTVEPREEVTFEVAVSGAPGGGSGGGGSGGCDLGTWGEADTSRRLAGSEGCVWTGIGGADSLTLTNPAMTPLTGNHDEVSTGSEYLRLTFVVTDGTTRYLVTVSDATDGLERTYGGDWSNRKVSIWRSDGDAEYTRLDDTELDSDVLDSWYRGETGMDLLSQQSYTGRHAGITELRNFVRNNEVRIRILENDGAVTLTADSVGSGTAENESGENAGSGNGGGRN